MLESKAFLRATAVRLCFVMKYMAWRLNLTKDTLLNSWIGSLLDGDAKYKNAASDEAPWHDVRLETMPKIRFCARIAVIWMQDNACVGRQCSTCYHIIRTILSWAEHCYFSCKAYVTCNSTTRRSAPYKVLYLQRWIRSSSTIRMSRLGTGRPIGLVLKPHSGIASLSAWW